MLSIAPTPEAGLSVTGWPTKAEAAQALGVSTKTIEKYVQDGKLEQRMQSQINKPARAVISPASIERMLTERTAAMARIAPKQGAEAVSAPSPEKFLEALSHYSWPPPLFLTTEQAVRYTGLSVGYLNGLVREGVLRRIEEGVRGHRYRRADLDTL